MTTSSPMGDRMSDDDHQFRPLTYDLANALYMQLDRTEGRALLKAFAAASRGEEVKYADVDPEALTILALTATRFIRVTYGTPVTIEYAARSRVVCVSATALVRDRQPPADGYTNDERLEYRSWTLHGTDLGDLTLPLTPRGALVPFDLVEQLLNDVCDNRGRL